MPIERLEGRARRFGDNVNTDYIISSRRKKETIDPQRLKAFLFEDIDPSIAATLKPDDIIVAGRNFGCGSAMEVAVTAVLGAGISCVIAQSFARTYFRNAINNGLMPVICDTSILKEGDGVEVIVEPNGMQVRNVTTGDERSASPLPPIMMQIISEGGLVPYLRARGSFRNKPNHQGSTS